MKAKILKPAHCLREYVRWKEILGIFFIVLAIYFLRHEHEELKQIKEIFKQTQLSWFIFGIFITLLYILLQGIMYQFSFRTVHSPVSLKSALILFLKRNLVSVFLPAGGITSLAFFGNDIEKQNVHKTKIHFASFIYGFTGIFSVFIIAIPLFIYLFIKSSITQNAVLGFSGLALLLALIVIATISIIKKGIVYKYILKWNPDFEILIAELHASAFSKKDFILTNIISIAVDFCGIIHLYIAMLAFGLTPSIEAAFSGYVVAVIFLIISPFIRGLGAIELSLTYILIQYGFTSAQAVAVMLLFRVFEFWLPLLAGAFSFFVNRNNILLRLFPPVLIFLLGFVNTISVLTPAIPERLSLVKEFIPLETIRVSNYFVLVAGVLLMVTGVFLIRGLKNAWMLATLLCVISIIGHLTKAIDYEEALIAFFTLIVLYYTRRHYLVRSNPDIAKIGISTSLLVMIAVMIYGVVGFYFLDKKHFGIDFSWRQSMVAVLQNFVLFNFGKFQPLTNFGRGFLYSINFTGFASLCFLFYTILKPYVFSPEIEDANFTKATNLVKRYGSSPVDYFKTYTDKLFYFSTDLDGFLAYRIARGFAVVLEDPVCENDIIRKKIIEEFDFFCRNNGLRNLFYRVDESRIKLFETLGKKSLLIGQEALTDVQNFNLEGGEHKSLRNSISNFQKKGLVVKINEPPLKDGTLQKLKLVSDEWLKSEEREELVFSQGLFDWYEIRNQTVITAENEAEKVLAFLNIIPDYVNGEGTYDLIRKTDDAPVVCIDILIVELIQYLKKRGYAALNLGMAPMSGIDKPKNFPERTVKFAYEKIQQFSHYKGLREAKEKFATRWVNKYLIYNQDYDLLQIPSALNKVMKP